MATAYASKTAGSVDEYLAAFPRSVKQKLIQIRNIIRKAAPDAVESISYAMPAYKLNGKPLVYFAGYDQHIGLYATPTGHSAFARELSVYKQGKGSVQFPLEKPLPLDLISRIVEFRVNELKQKSKPFKAKSGGVMDKEVKAYHAALSKNDRAICELLYGEIQSSLKGSENKVWHAHPVWFLEGNPIVGYSRLKDGIRLLFWSGQSFEEPGLKNEGKFKAAEIRYQKPEDVNLKDLKRWLKKATSIQWDYKNIVKRKGVLERLK